MRSLDKCIYVLKREVRFDLGNFPLLGRIEGEFTIKKILLWVLEIAKNSIREFGERFLVLRMPGDNGFEL